MMGVHLAESHPAMGTVSAHKNVYLVYDGSAAGFMILLSLSLTLQVKNLHLHSYFKMQENGLKVLALVTQHLLRLMKLKEKIRTENFFE